MVEIEWPDRWQDDARATVVPYLGRDQRLRIVVGDPVTSLDGTVIEGFVYLEGGVPTVIHDRSGRPGSYPWRLLMGPGVTRLRTFALEEGQR